MTTTNPTTQDTLKPIEITPRSKAYGIYSHRYEVLVKDEFGEWRSSMKTGDAQRALMYASHSAKLLPTENIIILDNEA